MDQLRWFDYWLKGIDTGIMDEPPVKLDDPHRRQHQKDYAVPFRKRMAARAHAVDEVLSQADQAANLGPDDQVEGDCSARRLHRPRRSPSPRRSTSHAGVASLLRRRSRQVRARIGVSFVIARPMPEDTEITGPTACSMSWVSSTHGRHGHLRRRCATSAPTARTCGKSASSGQPVPVTKGWLRASHRKLDTEKSLPYRPYHAHDERWWLEPGEPVECQIEIWPTCMVFSKGHRHAPRHPAARRRRQRALPALSGGRTTRAA